MNSKRKGQMWETLVPWIIGVIILALVIFFYLLLSDKGEGALGFLRDMIRFR